jgi:hypothetical protein
MTNLRTVLGPILPIVPGTTDVVDDTVILLLLLGDIVEHMLNTPAGKALAKVLETVEAQYIKHDDPDFGCVCDVCVALDELRNPEAYR